MTDKNYSIVRYLDRIEPVDCPYGSVRRVITGGEGSANVHVVCVSKGKNTFTKPMMKYTIFFRVSAP